MINKKAHNIILIMSAGSGQRFGADIPKQYCMMGGRPIIEYAIDAARYCPSVDEVVIVAAKQFVENLREKYGFPVAIGGSNRTESLANGLEYIANHYDYCEKVIVTNAVCPLMTEEQLDRYFGFLDEYDYVLTCWKVVSTLHRYDGEFVDRNDYFHVMEPEGYRFKLLHENYKKDYPVPYIFHQLPKTARGYYCFDYPYTMKITYASDIKIAKFLYDDIILRPKQERIRENIISWLSSFGSTDVTEWYSNISDYMSELANKYQIITWTINPKTFATCVFEAESKKYGNVILKFHAPSGRYEYEKAYYKLSRNGRMATLIDYNDDYRALLIKKIVPGLMVKFDAKNEELRQFFNDIANSFIPENEIIKLLKVKSIKDDFEINAEISDRFNFHNDIKHLLDNTVRHVWSAFFEDSPRFYLHRDIQRRNILQGLDGIFAIDPLGIIGPVEFEFTLSFIIESCASPDCYREIHNEMLEYFSKYCKKKRLLAALYITWVHKMDEYIFSKKDNCSLAEWCLKAIIDLFYEGHIPSVTNMESIVIPKFCNDIDGL